ncbi:sensor histidine kinase KdpD [Catellatospora sp. TT07R-123]|uniref:sensor histidine kinase n=1 Tax=Catellatospora sp. TT07R-123 TaxID=2733863 RepID=UPI001BB3A3A7|nr:nitrate- and nitrite sensing domain-containing protein [Catellatospora sp. TT07R-123]
MLPRTRDWRVRTRLTAVVVVPALAFLAVAGIQVAQAARSAAAGEMFADRVAVARAAAELVHTLQAERDRGVSVGAPSDRDAAIAATDAALAGWRGTVAGTDTAAAPSLARLPQRLLALRAGYQASGYDTIVDELITEIDMTAVGAVDQRLSQAAAVAGALARVKEAVCRLRGFGYSVPPLDGTSIAARVALLRQARTDAIARLEATAARATASGLPPVAVPDAAAADALAARLPGGAVDPAAWWDAASAEIDGWRAAERDLGTWLSGRAERQVDAVWRSVLVTAVVVLLVLLLAVGVSVAVGRGMLASLRELRRRALAVAEQELPQTLTRLRVAGPHDPLTQELRILERPGGTDEISEVAAAFEAVRLSAVELAVHQARSRRTLNLIFINLARRSQILVERQLRLLDEMERDERDPDHLAALFRLDHLAARLRRNDENLLVLAGAEPRRRWREGVPLAALALAALSEIEQYERVRADVADGLLVVGHAAADIGHLLAELLDNATAFSAPHTAVRVGARATAEGAEVEITDEGIGIGAEALSQLNALLARPAEVDVAASERMGLVVVSHLAARHGVRVRLAATGSGVCATVRLPATLLAEVELSGDSAASNSVESSISKPRGHRGREPDPEATAATLTRLYEGVRRGQARDDGAAPPAPNAIEGES